MTNIEFDRVLVKGANTIGTVKIVMVKGEKGDVGEPTDAQVETAVAEWLNDHPEATTTVQDGSISEAKLSNDVKAELSKINTKADAITKSASGSIASFSDGADDVPMKSLEVQIVPKQSGSGDPSPSNVRPISGYTDVNVKRVGKNLLKNTATTQTHAGITYTVNADGTIIANGTATNRSYCVIWFDYDYFSNYFKDGTYILSGCPSGGSQSTYALDLQAYGSGNLYDLGEGVTINTANLTNQTYRFVIDIKVGTTMNNAVFKPMLRLANTSAEYEPYNGTSYPISLGQTVYGGTLEVMSGKLTIDRGFADLGSLNWTYDGTRFYTRDIASLTKGYAYNVVADAICSIYKADIYSSIASQSVNNIFVIGETGTLSIKNTAYTDATAFKTAMNGHSLVYPLATPIEYQLTPTEVKTLLGSNNIFADSGDSEVEYRADTTLAYNELLSLIASLS